MSSTWYRIEEVSLMAPVCRLTAPSKHFEFLTQTDYGIWKSILHFCGIYSATSTCPFWHKSFSISTLNPRRPGLLSAICSHCKKSGHKLSHAFGEPPNWTQHALMRSLLAGTSPLTRTSIKPSIFSSPLYVLIHATTTPGEYSYSLTVIRLSSLLT